MKVNFTCSSYWPFKVPVNAIIILTMEWRKVSMLKFLVYKPNYDGPWCILDDHPTIYFVEEMLTPMQAKIYISQLIGC